MFDLALHRPSAMTKELALKTCPDHGGRKVVISSNFLDLFGFNPNSRYARTALNSGGQGFSLRLEQGGVQQVYRRTYPHRRANPFETVIDIGARNFLDETLPVWTERIHVVMRPGEVLVRPVPNHTFHIRKALRSAPSPLSAFVALSSGVDTFCLEQLGFTIDGLIEWRPPEARDSVDRTESGVITALSNTRPGVVFAEDITRLDMSRVSELVPAGRGLGCCHISLPCDDYSTLKGRALKERSLAEGTSTRDLVYDGLRLIETLKPASVVVENVPLFQASPEHDILSVRLRRWGYHVSSRILDARDFGGYTSRRRCYLVASVFPGFEFPAEQPRRTTPIWSDFADQIPLCRDVSHSKAVNDGVACGRAIVLTPESFHSATVAKSQARQAKDSLYIRTADGRYLLPTEAMLKRLNGIPDSFNLNGVTQELAIEKIGQSICMRMHEALLQSLRAHLDVNHHARPVGLIARPAQPIGQLEIDL
jgi:DNA (cytosine-5)-methyltransferase 1